MRLNRVRFYWWYSWIFSFLDFIFLVLCNCSGLVWFLETTVVCNLDISCLSSISTTFFFFLLVLSDYFSITDIPCLLVMLKSWVMCDFISIPCWSYNVGKYSYSDSRHYAPDLEITSSSLSESLREDNVHRIHRKSKGEIPLHYWHYAVPWKMHRSSAFQTLIYMWITLKS